MFIIFYLALLEYQKAFSEIHSDEQSSDKAVTGLDHLIGSTVPLKGWGTGAVLCNSEILCFYQNSLNLPPLLL